MRAPPAIRLYNIEKTGDDNYRIMMAFALDGDAARLHRLGQLTLEVKLQDAVGQRRTDDPDVVVPSWRLRARSSPLGAPEAIAIRQ